MRAVSATLVAARAVFRGEGFWRPGCLGCDSESDLDSPLTRHGKMGIWGEFEHNQPPSIDFLASAADSDQDVILDLIQIRRD